MKHLLILFIPMILLSCSSSKEVTVQEEPSNQLATQLAFTTQPSDTNASVEFSQQPVIEILDGAGQRVLLGADAWAPVTLSIYSGTGELSGTTTVNAVLGVAIFSGLKINASGAKVLKATKADRETYGGSGSLEVNSNTFTISAGTASKLAITGETTINSGDCAEYQVKHLDSGGNAIPTSDNLSVALSGNGSGTFYSDSNCTSSTTTVTISSGQSSGSFYFRSLGHQPLKFSPNGGTGLIMEGLAVSVVLPSISKIVASSTENGTDYKTTCLLYVSGAVSCWGSFSSSGLILFPEAATHLAVGEKHACVIVTSGKVYCLGASNVYGQVGIGITGGAYTTPQLVSSLSGQALGIAASSNHTCAWMDDNTVRCWGRNNGKSLGDLSTTNRDAPVQAQIGLTAGQSISGIYSGDSWVYITVSDGSIVRWGGNQNPAVYSDLTGVKSIAPGLNHSCAVMNDKTLKCWGANSFGQLGDGTTTTSATPVSVVGLSGIKQVGVGESHTCALLESGSSYCFGRNSDGYYGNYPYNYLGYHTFLTSQSTSPRLIDKLSFQYIAVRGRGTCGLTNEGTVYCWGDGLKLPTIMNQIVSDSSIINPHVSNSVQILPGTCTPLYSYLQHNSANVGVYKDLTLTYSNLFGVGNVFRDNACVNPLDTVYLPASTWTLPTIYYKVDQPTAQTIHAYIKIDSDEPAVGDSVIPLLIPGVASLALMYPYSEISSTCTTNNILVLDQNGNPTVSDQNIIVDLTYSSSEIKVYNSSDCSGPEVTQLTIPAGSSTLHHSIDLLNACSAGNITLSPQGGLSGNMATFIEDCGCD